MFFSHQSLVNITAQVYEFIIVHPNYLQSLSALIYTTIARLIILKWNSNYVLSYPQPKNLLWFLNANWKHFQLLSKSSCQPYLLLFLFLHTVFEPKLNICISPCISSYFQTRCLCYTFPVSNALSTNSSTQLPHFTCQHQDVAYRRSSQK